MHVLCVVFADLLAQRTNQRLGRVGDRTPLFGDVLDVEEIWIAFGDNRSGRAFGNHAQPGERP